MSDTFDTTEGRRLFAAFDDPSALDLTRIEGYSQYQEDKAAWRRWVDDNAIAMFDAIDRSSK